MPTKQRINQTDLDPDLVASQPADAYPWTYGPTEGPQALYRHMALAFLAEENLLGRLDEEHYDKAIQAAEAAIGIALTAAGVESTWNALYLQATGQPIIPAITQLKRVPFVIRTDDITTYPWQYITVPGPLALYTHMGLTFVREAGFLYGIDDQPFAVIVGAIEQALTVALTAAGVENTWTNFYQQVVAAAKETYLASHA